jgi:hypothetical protein
MDSFSINSENMMEIATTEEYRQACMEQYWIIKSYEYDYSVSLNDYNNAIQKYTWQLRCDDTEKVWYIEPDFIGNKKINDSLELPEEIEKIVEVKSEITCGLGTEDVNGICQVIQTKEKSKGGGCLIATATYGSEMATEVQQLRELRDNQLLNTASGTQFMSTFNDIYYSFSPTIADMEREHPMFKEAVKLAITPMISTLSLMETAESESEVLGLGLSVIMLNIGMYLGVPAIVVIGIRKRI